MHEERQNRLKSLVVKAERARASGDFQGAVRLAEVAAAERLAHPTLLRIRAEALRRSGKHDAAGELLNRALALAPRDAATHVELGRLLLADERADEATHAFERATELAPALVDAWRALAAARAGAGLTAEARAAWMHAIELAPDDADARADLAFMEARIGRRDAAVTRAGEALRLDAGHPVAELALARVEVDRDDYDAARQRLERVIGSRRLNPRQGQTALQLLADACHALGRTEEAFALYGHVKQTFATRHARRFGPGGPVEGHLAFIERLEAWFDAQPAAATQARDVPSSRAPAREHVFLLGYLRSGVTLVETVLASLPDVRVLEEGGALACADRLFLRDAAALARLQPLDAIAANEAREDYWSVVSKAYPDVEGQVFVDMSPLYGIKLPLIQQLFPAARIVFCRRDPRDVVLSCYRRNFSPNALTYELTSLERIARHYDAAMRLTAKHVAALRLPVHVVRYEQLVAQFDATTQALAQFVGAQWSEAVRQFDRTAAERDIATPSAPQVRRSLFDGSGQWRAYRKQLEPVLPLLAPWVEQFGYPTE